MRFFTTKELVKHFINTNCILEANRGFKKAYSADGSSATKNKGKQDLGPVNHEMEILLGRVSSMKVLLEKETSNHKNMMTLTK